MDNVGLQSAASQPADYNNHLGESLNSEPTQYLLGIQRENNPTLQSVLEDATFTMDVFAWGVKYHYIKPDGNLDSLNPDMMKDWKFTIDQIVQNINKLKNLNSSQLADLNNLSNTLNGLKEIKSMDEFMYKISPAYAQLEITISHLGFWRKSATQINPESWGKVTSALKEGATSESSSTNQSGSIFDVASKTQSDVNASAELQKQLNSASKKLKSLGSAEGLKYSDVNKLYEQAKKVIQEKGASAKSEKANLDLDSAIIALNKTTGFSSLGKVDPSDFNKGQIQQFMSVVEKTMNVPKAKPAVSLQFQLDKAKEKLATLGETGSLVDADLVQIKDAAISLMKSKGGSVDTLPISNAFNKLKNNNLLPSNFDELGPTYKPYISRQIGEFLEMVQKNSLGNAQFGTAAVAAKSPPAFSVDSTAAMNDRISAATPVSGRDKISNAPLSNPGFTLPVTSTSNKPEALGTEINATGKGKFASMTLNVRTADASDNELPGNDWPSRAKEIVALINESGADFINLQEVDDKKTFSQLGGRTQAQYILDKVDRNKYDAIPERPEKGLLIFYNKNNFKPVENEFKIKNIGFDHEGYVNNVNNADGVKPGQYERRIIGQLFEIRGTQPKRYMFQADLHGPHDDPGIVNREIKKLKDELQAMEGEYGKIPINIMGDFNMNPFVSKDSNAKTGLMDRNELNGAKISTQLDALANEVTKPVTWGTKSGGKGKSASGQNDFQISLTDNINPVDGTTIKTKVSDHDGVLVKNEVNF